MYSLILPELIVDVFKETGNKNTIKHFLDYKKIIEFEEFETQSNFVTIGKSHENW